MTVRLLLIPLFLVYGGFAGLVYLRLLRMQVGALAGGRGGAVAPILRLAVMLAGFTVAAMAGGAALLATLAGFVAARSVMLHRAQKVWP